MDEDLREDDLNLTRMTRSSVWTQVCTRAVVNNEQWDRRTQNILCCYSDAGQQVCTVWAAADPVWPRKTQKDTLYHHSAPLAVWDIVYIKFHSILCLKPNNHQEDDEKPVENWRLSYLLPLINFLDWIKYSTEILFCDSSFCPFSMWNLDQIWQPMAVLKSAHRDDSETPPTCLIWWSFGWDIWGWRKLKFFKN